MTRTEFVGRELAALTGWLRVAGHEDSTRETYVGYIKRTIKPTLGSMSIAKLSVRHLETLYAELRCRVRCDQKPFIECKAEGEHDCPEVKCKPHVCKPMAAYGPADPPLTEDIYVFTGYRQTVPTVP